jgi:2-polyprenyl-3-methyl-5-hydroxy-6-metoxy-1,4-benzoquinol methylase
MKGPDSSNSNNFQSLREIIYGFQKSRIVLTAFELDLFSVINEGTLTSEEIAGRCQTETKAMERLLNALVALDLLCKENDKFSNSQIAKQYLTKGSPTFMGGIMHSVNLWDTWSNLTQSVKTGIPSARQAINDRGENWLEAFIAAMHDRARQQATPSVALLNLDGVKRVLDLGGGSGAFAMAFVDAAKDITATVFDLKNVIPLTKKYILDNGYSNRIDTLAGDYTVDSIGFGYDLIFLSAIIHSNSYETNKRLVAKCAASLNPGGQLVIQDHIMSKDRTQPIQGAVFAINMLVGTQEGDCFTSDEIRYWMSQAGLTDFKQQPAPQGVSQMIGFKTI